MSRPHPAADDDTMVGPVALGVVTPFMADVLAAAHDELAGLEL